MPLVRVPFSRYSVHVRVPLFKLSLHHRAFLLINAWKGGCIIRSELLYTLSKALINHDLEKPLMTNPDLIKIITQNFSGLSSSLSTALQSRAVVPVLMATYQYLLAMTSNWSSANMIQAQRDYFGAHRYEKINDPSGTTYHTNWNS